MTAITLLGHSAISLDNGGSRLVIDPGAFSDLAGLADAAAVLVTHGHPDHVAAAALVGVTADVWAPAAVVTQLEEAGVPADRLHAVAPGDTFDAAGFDIAVVGTGLHAEIYPSLPPVANNAYLIDGRLLVPGDSFTAAPDPEAVEVLFAPVMAPWLKLAETIDYAKRHPNATVVPVHDGLLADSGRTFTDNIAGALIGSAYRRIPAGEATEI
ncbi:L-ascorbate metabolism protein UlaG, beta-lactamase superfamily [Agromyces sp. CF514]|uniref:MBL fold metallo-hydrolase n=1 Tax=Agromyces sp. CF514 TaxID=1881031 RepID=UPI0008ED014D|nr:MBL fold metallo-hydrolase [Agromyces sp. CF514]SFR90535.1 L-ascorbate metabolism protein UlaG, beta-lactamase superfamily [Agromyces sp. CF514]